MQVILEMASNIWQVDHAFHADGCELIPRSDAREQQQVRRPDGARGQHDLSTGGHHFCDAIFGSVGNAGRAHCIAIRLEQDPLDESASYDGEVLTVHRRLEVGMERRASLTVLRRGLEQ